MRRQHVVPFCLVLAGLVFWGAGLWREATYAGFSPNDFYAHESLLQAVTQDWRAGRWGLDVWHEQCCLGAPLFRTYQPLGHFLAAALSQSLGLAAQPGLVLHLLTNLALVLGCLAFYASARLIGASRWQAAACSILCLTINSALPLGHELSSYDFVGEGLFTQALSVPFFVLGLAFALRLGDKRLSGDYRRETLALAVCLSLCFGFQHLYGYLLALSIAALGVLAWLSRAVSTKRFLFIALVTAVCFAVLNGFQVLSILQDAALYRRGEYDPSVRWDGWGWEALLRVVRSGWVWDYDRWPLFTTAIGVGVFSLCRRNIPRAQRFLPLLLLGGFVLLVGRAGFGALFDWIPGMEKFQLERANVLLHIPGILLAGLGIGALLELRPPKARYLGIALAVAMTSYLLVERARFLSLDRAALATQDQAMREWDPKLLASLGEEARRGYIRTYRWNKDEERIGKVPFHCIASRFNIPQIATAFYNGTYTSENIYNFSLDNPEYYRFFNVTGALIPPRVPAPDFLEKVYDSGAQASYRMRTDGPLAVIAIPRVSVVPNDDYVRRLRKTFFYDGFRADGIYSSLVPEAIAKRWPQALPEPSHAPVGAQPGRVLSWEHSAPSVYRATLQANAPHLYGMLRQAYHPNWQVRVNGQAVTPRWGTPGMLAFPLEAGRNTVEIRFPEDNLRLALFLVAVAGYLAVAAAGLVHWSRRLKLSKPRAPLKTQPAC